MISLHLDESRDVVRPPIFTQLARELFKGTDPFKTHHMKIIMFSA